MVIKAKGKGDLSAFDAAPAPAGKAKSQAPAPAGKAKPQVPAKMDGDLIVKSNDLPDYIKGSDKNRGSEHVGIDDLVVPRLEVVQALSPAVKQGDAGYIEGAQPGMLTNSVTRQLYGREVFVVPVHYTKQFLVWKDRKAGGGFFGAFANPDLAKERIAQIEGDKSQVMIIDTPQHFCLLVTAGRVEEVMVAMPRTKAKISRQWNTFVRLAGNDRFARVYRIGTMLEKNQKGDFYNFTVSQSGFPAQRLYKQAEELYERIASGERAMVMDVNGFVSSAGEGDEDESSEM